MSVTASFIFQKARNIVRKQLKTEHIGMYKVLVDGWIEHYKVEMGYTDLRPVANRERLPDGRRSTPSATRVTGRDVHNKAHSAAMRDLLEMYEDDYKQMMEKTIHALRVQYGWVDLRAEANKIKAKGKLRNADGKFATIY